MCQLFSWEPCIVRVGVTFPFDKVLCALSIPCRPCLEDLLDFVVPFFSCDDDQRWFLEIRAMCVGFFVRLQEGVVENWVDPHLRREVQLAVSGGCP